MLSDLPYGFIDEECTNIADNTDDDHPHDGQDDTCIKEWHGYD